MNKLLLGIIVLLFVIGAIALVNSQSKTPSTSTSSTPQERNNSQVSSKAPSEEATKAKDAMMAKEETVVTVTKNAFNPQSVTVKAGTKVVWKNESGAMANVSSAIHPTHQVYPSLNLDNFVNDSQVSLVFDKPGTYKYHDHLRPSLTGTVVVK